MADIINLRKVRKAKGRADAKAQAAENQVKFGRSKDEKQASQAAKRIAERRLEAHRRGEKDE